MSTTSIRFTGLASGLDTESIVESMITPYKNKVDAAKQDQTLMEWKKEAWRDMNQKLFNFYNEYVSKARLETTYNKRNISVSNTNVIEVGTNSTLPEGSHTIDRVTQLAKSATLSTVAIYKEQGGEKVKADKSTTLKELVPPIDPPEGYAVLKVNDGGDDAYISITGEMTVGELEKALQQKLGKSNVNFDTSAGAFFIGTKKTGASQSISMEVYNYAHDGSDTSLTEEQIDKTKLTADKQNPYILKKLGLSSDYVATLNHTGDNAKVSYNGVEVESETNNISVNGFNFTVKGKTDEAITVTSTFDTEAVVSYVKEFVEAYNTLIADIQEKIDADSTSGYAPLTDEQKETMTDDEIEKWEAKIKGSLFRKDADLEKLLTDMRGIFGSNVEGNDFGALSQIGITTGAWNEKGKLYIDEDKLRAAVNENAQGVIDLFSKNGTTTKETGYMDRLYDMITTQTKSSKLRSMYSFYNDKLLTQNISDQEEVIAKLEERMYNMEDMYYARFTAMEKMLSQLNSQGDYLTSLLGGA